MVMDREIPTQEAFSRYGTTDVYRLAALMQREADEQLGPKLVEDTGAVCASVKVEPLSA